MKIVIIGDTHGLSIWKDIILKEEPFDKIIFIGDYLDSFDVAPTKQLENLADIIQFKKDNLDKVILLFGNHDYHYLMDNLGERYSGFQYTMRFQFGELFKSNINLFQIAYNIEPNIICSHAGISKTWTRNNGYYFDEIDEEDYPIVEFVNDLFKYKPLAFRFQGKDPHGFDNTQSPIWIRPTNLVEDGLDNIIQIVGHTVLQQIAKVSSKVWCIDTLSTSKEYLVIEDDNFIVKTLDL